MKRTVWLWELFGFAVASLGGTVLHFLYELLGKPVWIAPFSGVNESTFEHMKLLFWPMLVYTVIQSFFFRGYESFAEVKLRGTLLGLALIPLIFYTYNGVIGHSPDWINIAIFFISAAAAYIYEARALKADRQARISARCAYTGICLIGLAFVLFTFLPPELAIFKDPITGVYGA